MTLSKEENRCLIFLLSGPKEFDLLANYFFKNAPDYSSTKESYLFRQIIKPLEERGYLTVTLGKKMPTSREGVYIIDKDSKTISLNWDHVLFLWQQEIIKKLHIKETIEWSYIHSFLKNYQSLIFDVELLNTLFPLNKDISQSIYGIITTILFYITTTQIIKTDYVFYNEHTQKETDKYSFSPHTISYNARGLFRLAYISTISKSDPHFKKELFSQREAQFAAIFETVISTISENSRMQLQFAASVLFDSIMPYTQKKNVKDWIHVFRFSRLLSYGFPHYLSDESTEKHVLDRNRVFIDINTVFNIYETIQRFATLIE